MIVVAVVKMGQIKTTPGKAIAYITRPDATDEGVWVSTNAAVIDPSDWGAIARQFEETSERVGVTKPRAGSVLAHHVIQSFDPDENVDAERAHQLGVQLAEKVTGGSHEYVIATHLDKGHVHNHIIFNAVNMETGRKFRCVKSTIGSIRDMSDALCQEAGLRVLPKPERASGKSFADIYRVLKGDSAKEFLRTEIDKAAAASRTWTDFEAALRLAGIETGRRSGRNAAVTFRAPTTERAVRDWRLGEAYTEDAIMARLSKSAVNRITFDQSMIVKESRDAMTINVPGTGRKLRLTVAKSQVVRHGRTVRAFIPAEQQHMLADAKGKLSKTVDTAGLYQWFSEPDLPGLGRGRATGAESGPQIKSWIEALSDLRDMQERVNAKTRWVTATGGDVDAALVQARGELVSTRLEFQTKLVAASELMTTPEGAGDLQVVQAEIRILERDIESLKRDVRALTEMSKEEVKMSVSERINAGIQRRAAEDTAQRARLDDQAGDRETPTHQVEREWAYEDAEQNDVDTTNEEERAEREEDSQPQRPLTLAERIEAEAARRQAEARGEQPNKEGRNRGWNL